MTALQSLTLCDSLQRLPASLGELNLRYLMLGHVKHVDTLPGICARLTSLETLRIAGCDTMQELPTLSLMKSLTLLALCECLLIKLLPCVKSLTAMQQLRYLINFTRLCAWAECPCCNTCPCTILDALWSCHRQSVYWQIYACSHLTAATGSRTYHQCARCGLSRSSVFVTVTRCRICLRVWMRSRHSAHWNWHIWRILRMVSPYLLPFLSIPRWQNSLWRKFGSQTHPLLSWWQACASWLFVCMLLAYWRWRAHSQHCACFST